MVSRTIRPSLSRITLLRETIQHWNQYPFSVPVIQHLDALDITHRVCFFVGENGSGKSTLLEALADHFGLGKQGGSRHITHETVAEDATRDLANALRLSWRKKLLHGYFLRAESFFNIATYLDSLGDTAYAAYGGTSLHRQSHGESFLSLFQHRFSRDGFYLLDEPEAALSPQRQLSFLVILHDLVTSTTATQFIIATHSPLILAYPEAQIVSFDDGRIADIAYRETQPFKITSAFLSDPERYVRSLLG